MKAVAWCGLNDGIIPIARIKNYFLFSLMSWVRFLMVKYFLSFPETILYSDQRFWVRHVMSEVRFFLIGRLMKLLFADWLIDWIWPQARDSLVEKRR